jgi:hypothetical protein
MSKKKRARGAAVKPRRVKPFKVAITVLVACVIAAGAAATRFEPVRRTIGLAPLPVPVAQQQNLSLSKEYIYAGGRLVATEEPTPQGGPPPTNLLATVTPTGTVAVTWTAPTASISSYVVERAQSGSGPFTPLTPNPTSTSFTDVTAAADTAYFYRVKAIYTAGGNSDYSNRDLATTVIFTDDPIIPANDPQGRPATTIYARHLTELRRAVNAVRGLAGLGAASWTYPDPVSTPDQRRMIYLEDVTELRARLGEALSALSLPAPTYADPTINRYTTVRKAHVQELRDAVK